MKKIITFLTFILFTLTVKAQITPPMDTTANRYANRAYMYSKHQEDSLFTLKGICPMTVLSKSANYTILSTDWGNSKVLYVPVDCTSGSLTLTIPTASSFTGYVIFVTKTDATANTITISGLGSDNVIGTKLWTKQCISNGTNWINN